MANNITSHTKIHAVRQELRTTAKKALVATDQLAKREFHNNGGYGLVSRVSDIRKVLNQVEENLTQAERCANALAEVRSIPKVRSISYSISVGKNNVLIINTTQAVSEAERLKTASRQLEELRQIILACKREFDAIKVTEQLVSSLNVLDFMFPAHGLTKAALIAHVRDQGSKHLQKAAVNLGKLAEYFMVAYMAVLFGTDLFGRVEDRARKAFFQAKIAQTSQITPENKPSYGELQKEVSELEEMQRNYIAVYGVPSPELEEEIKRLKKMMVTEVEVPLIGQKTNVTCGPTSASMVLQALGINVTEDDISKHIRAKKQTPSGREYLVAALNDYLGEQIYEFKQSYKMSLATYYDTIRGSLEKGYPVMVMIKATSQKYKDVLGYSTGGHYMVITGVYQDANGQYRVMINDPYSKGFSKSGGNGAPQQLDIPLETLKGMSEKHSGSIILAKEKVGARK